MARFPRARRQVTSLVISSFQRLTLSRLGDFSPTIRHNPLTGFQASLLIKLEKLDWSSILDNKSNGHAR